MSESNIAACMSRTAGLAKTAPPRAAASPPLRRPALCEPPPGRGNIVAPNGASGISPLQQRTSKPEMGQRKAAENSGRMDAPFRKATLDPRPSLRIRLARCVAAGWACWVSTWVVKTRAGACAPDGLIELPVLALLLVAQDACLPVHGLRRHRSRMSESGKQWGPIPLRLQRTSPAIASAGSARAGSGLAPMNC
jgi:hypothetical protein